VILHDLLPISEAAAQTQDFFQVEIPADRPLQVRFAFTRCVPSKMDFLVPDTILKVICDLDTMSNGASDTTFIDDRTPSGERDVFNMLAAGPDDWVALHSLDLHPGIGVRTEIDFLVVVLTQYAVIEVKSKTRSHSRTINGIRQIYKRSPF